MTIASAIQAKQQQVADSYTAVSNKGGTLPATQNLTNLATAISTIPSGGSAPVITSLSVTPTTSAQTITAPSGTDGYSPVNVAAVTAAIDQNITAANIVSGISILGVNGSATVLNGETRTATLTSSAGNTFTPSSGKNGITSITVTPNNEARSVTPSTSAQTLSVNSGYSGNGTISVSAVTSSIDANIQAGNIKKDVQILGVTGTYEGSGGGGDSGAGRVFNANFWVDTSGVVHNFVRSDDSTTLSAFATTLPLRAFRGAYISNTTIKYADFSNIKSAAGERTFEACFYMTYISKIDFYNLEEVGSYCFRQFLRNTVNVDIYFNSLKTTSFLNVNAFYYMCQSAEDVTIHLPSNLQSVVSTLTGYPNFRGTNTVLAFDLPATS